MNIFAVGQRIQIEGRLPGIILATDPDRGLVRVLVGEERVWLPSVIIEVYGNDRN
jgi:hypothetical protein